MDVPKKNPAAPAQPRKRRWPRRLGATILVLLAIAGAIGIFRTVTAEPGVGHFRTAAGAAEYRASYTAAMERMPEPSAVHDVQTDYGVVRVVEWVPDGGASDDPDDVPVVLLPGRSSGIPMWSENLPGFLEGHRVLAIDALGDAGLSVQGAPLESFEDQAIWIDQALSGLAPEGAHIVGHSFGGATAAAYATEFPDRVVSLSLIEPVFTVAIPPLSMLWWGTVSSLPGMPEGVRDHALARVGGAETEEVADPTDPVARMIAAASAHYSAQLPTPSPLTAEQAERLTMPVYLALAGKDSFAGTDAEANAAELLSGAEVEVWPEATHSLPMQEAGPLTARLDDFWAAAERARP